MDRGLLRRGFIGFAVCGVGFLPGMWAGAKLESADTVPTIKPEVYLRNDRVVLRCTDHQVMLVNDHVACISGNTASEYDMVACPNGGGLVASLNGQRLTQQGRLITKKHDKLLLHCADDDSASASASGTSL